MKCENCGSRKVEHYDVEGVPFCQKCWDDPMLWEPTDLQVPVPTA